MKRILNTDYFDVNDIRNTLVDKWYNKDFDDTGNVAIISASFVADEAYIIRPPNVEYVERELKWYLSESLNVNDIPDGVPTIWQQVSDKDGFINSNYGWTTFSKENYSQFDTVVE